MTATYAFTDDELEYMRNVQEGHMMDTCVFQHRTVTPNTYNEQVETWPTDSAEINCGLDMRPGSERRGVDSTVLQYDAVLRLPITTSVDVKDKIRITKRFGEILTTPLTYEIVGPVQRGPSGIRVLLKRIDL